MATALEDKKKAIEVKGRIREFIFGIQDALISTVGLLAGIQKASPDSKAVIIAGIAAAFTGALSMGTGSYLSSKAQKEIFEKELKDQEKFVEGEPYLAKEGLLETLQGEGLSRESAYKVVALIAKQKNVFIRTFQEKVLGVGSADISDPLKGAAVMCLSFIVGAAVPVLPYCFLRGNPALGLSVGLSGLALFGVGAFKNHVAEKSLFRGGLEFLTIAIGSAGVGWLVGSFFE